MTTYAGARPSDPSTSHEAAAVVANSHLEQDVYQFLLEHRGRYMTVIEIAQGMGMHPWSISPRMLPLWRKGLLLDPIKKAGLNSAGKIRNLQAWQVK